MGRVATELWNLKISKDDRVNKIGEKTGNFTRDLECMRKLTWDF